MASTLQQELLEYFAAAAGEQAPDMNEAIAASEHLADSLMDVKAQASDLPPVPTPSSTQAAAAPAALAAPKTAASTTGGDKGSSVATTVLKSGFGLLPLIGALIGLFGGGESSAPEPLVKYAMPERIDIESAETDAGWSSVDYDQMGAPRAYGAPVRRSSTPTSETGGGAASAWVSSFGSTSPTLTSEGGGAAEDGRRSALPQITVNVQAMDARSFLDRSGDIAAAVRNAMLNLNSINDVVNDL